SPGRARRGCAAACSYRCRYGRAGRRTRPARPPRKAARWSGDLDVRVREEGLALDDLRGEPGRPDRPVADQRHPVQDPLYVEMTEVGRAEVRGGPVVPERDAARLPSEPHGVIGAGDLLVEQVEDAAAFHCGHPEDV